MYTGKLPRMLEADHMELFPAPPHTKKKKNKQYRTHKHTTRTNKAITKILAKVGTYMRYRGARKRNFQSIWNTSDMNMTDNVNIIWNTYTKMWICINHMIVIYFFYLCLYSFHMSGPGTRPWAWSRAPTSAQNMHMIWHMHEHSVILYFPHDFKSYSILCSHVLSNSIHMYFVFLLWFQL